MINDLLVIISKSIYISISYLGIYILFLRVLSVDYSNTLLLSNTYYIYKICATMHYQTLIVII